MARYLSAEWFQEISRHFAAPAAAGQPRRDDRGEGSARLVLQQVVTGTPDGEVRYLVVVAGGQARIIGGGGDEGRDVQPDVTITTDWATAVALAKGSLAAQAALMEGRLRVRGNLATLSRHADSLVGLDPVPVPVREATTY